MWSSAIWLTMCTPPPIWIRIHSKKGTLKKWNVLSFRLLPHMINSKNQNLNQSQHATKPNLFKRKKRVVHTHSLFHLLLHQLYHHQTAFHPQNHPDLKRDQSPEFRNLLLLHLISYTCSSCLISTMKNETKDKWNQQERDRERISTPLFSFIYTNFIHQQLKRFQN